MQNSLQTIYAFYLGFSENSLYSSKYSLKFIFIDQNTLLVKSPDLNNFSINSLNGTKIPLEDSVDYFTDVLLVLLSSIVNDFHKPLHSISLKYSSISKNGIDNHDGIIRDIRLRFNEIDTNSRSKVKHLSRFFTYEDIHNFSKISLCNILTNRELNTEIDFIIYVADPNFIS